MRQGVPGTDPIKPCGSCSLCCKLTPVLSLDKPAYRWCHLCAPGKGGCTRYEARPSECRVYQCLWSTSPGMREALRPDRCKAVMEGTEDSAAVLVTLDPAYPYAHHKEPLRGFLRMLVQHQGLMVGIMSDTESAELWLPEGRQPEEFQASFNYTHQQQLAREENEA